MRILIGTSGFSYPDWSGQFYPRGLKRDRRLAYYATQFPAVEINASYYGIPAASTTERWASQVPPGFEFVVKAHRDMTHGESFEPDTFAEFRAAMAPLCRMGMLGAVLAQFPYRFRRTAANERYLATIREELPLVPVVVEFRNREWAAPEIFELLRSLGLGYCCVDEPRFRNLMPPVAEATAEVGYVRFHGRNAGKWWRGSAEERYDYRYTREELREWVPKIAALAAETEKTYVFFNNHFEANAGLNARDLMDLVQRELPGLEVMAPAPPTMARIDRLGDGDKLSLSLISSGRGGSPWETS